MSLPSLISHLKDRPGMLLSGESISSSSRLNGRLAKASVVAVCLVGLNGFEMARHVDLRLLYAAQLKSPVDEQGDLMKLS